MSDTGPKGYRFAGDVQLTKVTFVGIDGSPIDITNIVSTVNVYQNMFRHYLECDLIFTDASKFLHQLPYLKDRKITGGFTGSEIVVIEYKENATTGTEKTLTHIFRVYGVTDRNSIENAEIYLMSGISEEGWQIQAKRISKTYGKGSGNTIENMIQSIFKQYFQSQAITDTYSSFRSITGKRVNKQLNTMPTNGIHKFIIPNLTVDATINFLCDEADCKTKIPYFVFYEDSENFNFANVNGLTAQDPVDEYFYAKTNIASTAASDNKEAGQSEVIIPNDKIIVGYRVNRQHDFMENIKVGLYRSSTNSIDMLKKKSKTVVYDYQDYSKLFNKLQENIISGSVVSDVPVQSFMTSRTGHSGDSLFVAESPLPKRTNITRDIRQSFLSSIFNTNIEVTVPGNLHLKVGQVIKLSFPVDTDESDLTEEDKYLTGNYLVTKVRQIFTPNSTETVLECTKDGGM